MNLETTFATARVPVTILTTHGDIDGSNYQELIKFANKLYQNGTRNILLDLGDTPFISSSGLVALHSIALLLNGGKPLNIDDGWSALSEMGDGLGSLQTHLKLLNVQKRVDHTLDISGFKPFYELFNDKEAALASFQPEEAAAAS